MTRHIDIHAVRNFGIIAHVDAGKTTLTERLLYFSGAVHRMGEVHHGSTVTDSEELERQKGITIRAATVNCRWRDHELCLIDTPGHIDFSAEVELSLRVLDGAVVLLDGVAGVEAQTETVWRQAERHGLPRICFVNKLDRAGANFAACVAELRQRLGARVAVTTLPLGAEDRLEGVIDLIEEQAVVWSSTSDGAAFERVAIPAEVAAAAREQRSALAEICADFDAEVLSDFVGGRPSSPAVLRRALRAGTLRGELVPTLCGSAYKRRGVQQLLDAVVDYLPAPADRPALVGPDGERRAPADDAALAALVFKVVHDDFGQTALVRVFSGTLDKGTRVLNPRSGRSQRIGRLVRVFADRRFELARAHAGDIVGVVGLTVGIGDTLCAPDQPLVLGGLRLPEPVVQVALEPKTSADHQRLGPALARLTGADPSLSIATDAETGQVLLSGLGELHIEVAVEKLRREHRAEVSVGRPRVAYREAISKEVKHDYKHSKQTGGPGQFAHVFLRIAPAAFGAGLIFENEVGSGAIPGEFIAGVRAGVEEAMSRGALAGYPLADVRVAVVDGVTHKNDSSELAFKIAARQCFLEAAARAEPYLLEPIMSVEAVTPDAHVGSVVSDLCARRGRIVELGGEALRRVVRAEVPLAEAFGYAGALRSLTQGRGTFSMTFETYQAVPSAVAERVIERSVA